MVTHNVKSSAHSIGSTDKCTFAIVMLNNMWCFLNFWSPNDTHHFFKCWSPTISKVWFSPWLCGAWEEPFTYTTLSDTFYNHMNTVLFDRVEVGSTSEQFPPKGAI